MTEKIVSRQTLIAEASEAYKEMYGDRPSHVVSAPGRVNLIGEHTDYNDGFVLPMALPMVTVAVGGVSDDQLCHVTTLSQSAGEPRTVSFQPPSSKHCLAADSSGAWSNYVKGVVAHFKGEVPPFCGVVASSVPLGGGLSSSASLEVAIYTLLEAITGNCTACLEEKAQRCQRAEHEFAAVPCGIMDQLVCVMARQHHALLIDCRLLHSELIMMPGGGGDAVTVLVINSHVRHQLASSEYRLRRDQCQQAARQLCVNSLRDLSAAQLQERGAKLLDAVVFKRARHVVTEIERTQLAARALQCGDFVTLGRLMVESHQSLRDDYEVSCVELDILVSAACEVSGVFGSRMTGAGFGGCTVTVLKNDAVDECVRHVRKQYGERLVSFFTCHPSQGASILQTAR